MALSMTALSPAVTSGNIPGAGFYAIVDVAFDNSYITTGEVLDLSGVFPNAVYGATVIASTLNDGGWHLAYVPDTAGAPATGVIQVFGVQTVANTTCGPLLNALTAWDVSAMTGQRFVVFGR